MAYYSQDSTPSLFFTRKEVGERMIICSEITGKTYDTESAKYIQNMLQNYCFVFLGCGKDLLDIVAGENDRLYFVWKKDTPSIRKAFDRWCLRSWKG